MAYTVVLVPLPLLTPPTLRESAGINATSNSIIIGEHCRKSTGLALSIQYKTTAVARLPPPPPRLPPLHGLPPPPSHPLPAPSSHPRRFLDPGVAQSA